MKHSGRNIKKNEPITMTNMITYSDNSLKFQYDFVIHLTRNTCIAEPREARGEAHKMSRMEGGENWSKLGNLGGRISTLALRLEGEM